jgi:hypothetical protein
MGPLYDEGGVGLSMQALRLLHRSFSTSISALSRRPGHYGLCILCHCTILSNIYARYTMVSCQCRPCAAGYALTYVTTLKLQLVS